MKSLADLRKLFEINGIPTYRANQVYNSIYKEGKTDFSQITVLPLALRGEIQNNLRLSSVKEIRTSESGNKDTQKVLFELIDGEKIESVLMRFKDGRNTVCVSCQVGCPMKCAFCATGKSGFKRNLTYEEITDQALYFQQKLIKEGSRIDHIVFMGMGEPMLNYDEILKAIKIFNDPASFNIGYRHLTVSTSGIVPGIRRLAEDAPQVNLAVSLHAPNDRLRKKLMPVAETYSLKELMTACREYTEKTHRRITYEYVMLNKINDSEELAGELAALLRGQLCHVNLIPFNETKIKGMKASLKDRISQFAKILEINNIPVTIRVSLGKEIQAACGQLAGKHKNV